MKLRTQKEEDQNRKSRLIKDKLFRSQAFKKAKTVMFYISFDGEVNTEDMIKDTKKLGKTVVVPVCRRNRMMEVCLLDDCAGLKEGPCGILEPVVKKSVELKKLNLIVVPGVAFDARGRRLGRGKGYYDRFLKKLPKKITSIGLAFDFQILPALPATSRDAPVSRVIFA